MSTSEVWVELKVETPLELSEAVNALLWELPVEGVQETSASSPEHIGFVAFLAGEEHHATLSGLRTRLEQLSAERPHLSPVTLVAQPHVLEEPPTAQEWRASLEIQHIGARLVLVPVGQKYTRAEHEVVIKLEPGEAFGDGRHETTRACLRAIDALLGGTESPEKGSIKPLKGEVSVLDVGTGSGVLLLAALKLGARKAVGLEIDETAAATALENRDRNQMQRRARISLAPLEEQDGLYRLVIANILTQRVLALKQALVARLAQEGALVLSGIVEEQAEEVKSAFEGLGLSLEAHFHEGGWVALVFVKHGTREG